MIDFDKYYKITTQGCDTSGFAWLATLVDYGLNKGMFDGCKRILDIGCGTGCWTGYLKQKGFEVIGCDIDNSQFDEAIITDMHNLCFYYGEFDGILCTGIFEHSIAPFIALHEMNRVLKIGGILYIDMPATENIRVMNLPQHVNTQGYDNMINLAYKVGFKLVEYKVMDVPVAGLHQMFIFKKEK